MSTARMQPVREERHAAKHEQAESKMGEHERRDEEKRETMTKGHKTKGGMRDESAAEREHKGRVSPLLQPGVKAVDGHAPLPQSPAMAGEAGSGAPPLQSLLQGLPGDSLPSPRKILVTNSRTQKKAAKVRQTNRAAAAWVSTCGGSESASE